MRNNKVLINEIEKDIDCLTFQEKYNIGGTDIATILIKYADSFGDIKTYPCYTHTDGYSFKAHIVAKKEDIPDYYHHLYTLKTQWIDFFDDDEKTLSIYCIERPTEINIFRAGDCGICIYLNYSEPLSILKGLEFDLTNFKDHYSFFKKNRTKQKPIISCEFDFLKERWFVGIKDKAVSLNFYVDSINYVKSIYEARSELDLFYKHLEKFNQYFDTEQYLLISSLVKQGDNYEK